MDVHMENGLTGRRASVHTNVEAVHIWIIGRDALPQLSEHRVDRVYFRLVQVKIISNVPLGNDQRMHFGDGEGIMYGDAEFVFCDDPVRPQ